MDLSLVYRAIRPLAWAPFFIGYFFGVGLGNATLNSLAWIGAVAASFGCISGIAMNNYADRNLDKKATGKDINLKMNPWATGELRFRDMLVLAICPTLLMLLLSYLISPLFLLLTVLSWVAGSICYSYPLYLKGKAPFDVVCMPIATFVFPFLAGYWLNGVSELPLFQMIFCMIFGVDIFIASEVWDIEADRQADLRTTAVALGKQKSERIRAFLKIMQVAVAIVIMVVYPLKWQIFGLGILLTSLIPSYKYLKLQWISFLVLTILILAIGAF